MRTVWFDGFQRSKVHLDIEIGLTRKNEKGLCRPKITLKWDRISVENDFKDKGLQDISWRRITGFSFSMNLLTFYYNSIAMQPSKLLKLIFPLLILSFPSTVFPQVDKKPRVVVLTDIEADPDDTQALIRLLL
jgi:hypothetical protein